MTSFGPGSEGVPFAPTPGFTYAGDAWCYQCSAYVPAETNGQVRLGDHSCQAGRCPGSLVPVQLQRPSGAQEGGTA